MIPQNVIEDLITALTARLKADFSNFDADNRKSVKDKLNILSIDDNASRPAEPLENDIIFVKDASTEENLSIGQWAIYWYVGIEWIKITDESVFANLDGDEIINLINSATENIETGNINFDFSTILTASNLNTTSFINSMQSETFTLAYKLSIGNVTASSFNPPANEDGFVIKMPNFTYVSGENGMLYINGTLVEPPNASGAGQDYMGKYYIRNNTGVLEIVLHGNDAINKYIEFEISSTDNIVFYYPKFANLLNPEE